MARPRLAVVGGGRFGLMHLRAYKQLEREGRAELVGLATLTLPRGAFLARKPRGLSPLPGIGRASPMGRRVPAAPVNDGPPASGWRAPGRG